MANGRAMTTDREDGFIRAVYRAAGHAVVGIQTVGAGLSELSAAFALAIEMGACLEDIAATIHAHPTRLTCRKNMHFPVSLKFFYRMIKKG